MTLQYQYLKNRGVNYIYHATPLLNFKSILNNGGLLSRNILNNKGMWFIPVDSLRIDNRLDYISCSYNDINYRYLRDSEYSLCSNLVKIEIKLEIILKRKALFFPYNAANTYYREKNNNELSSLTLLKETFSDTLQIENYKYGVFTITRSNHPNSKPTADQAEIMIKDTIPLEYINAIYVGYDFPSNIVELLMSLNIPVYNI